MSWGGRRRPAKKTLEEFNRDRVPHLQIQERQIDLWLSEALESTCLNYNGLFVLQSASRCKALERVIRWHRELLECFTTRQLKARLDEVWRLRTRNISSISTEEPAAGSVASEDNARKAMEYLQMTLRLPPSRINRECGAIDQMSDTRWRPKFWVMILPSPHMSFRRTSSQKEWRRRNRHRRGGPGEQNEQEGVDDHWICTNQHGWFKVFYTLEEDLNKAVCDYFLASIQQEAELERFHYKAILLDSSVDPRTITQVNSKILQAQEQQQQLQQEQHQQGQLPYFVQHKCQFQLPLHCFVESAVSLVKRKLSRQGLLVASS